MLYLIGWGAQDFTMKGMHLAKSCPHVFVESYTGKVDSAVLQEQVGRAIQPVSREDVEQRAEQLLEQAKKEDVAIIITGDPLVATTHTDLLLRARRENVATTIIPNTSILTLVALSGLQLYKFGKTASIPRPTPSYHPETPYNILQQNQSINAHTLFLLDTNNHVTIPEAIEYLLKIEQQKKEECFTPDTFCVGCARLGTDNNIMSGTAKKLARTSFGPPPHCLIVPATLHFMEKEFLNN